MSSPGHGRPRILIRGVNWLGDAVMTTPALLRLREASPTAHITLLTPAKLADLWRHHPAVDQVIGFDADERPVALGRRLRAERFDIGLVLPNSFRGALELWCAGVPERVGYEGQWRSWLLTRPVPPRPGAIRMQKRSVREILRLRSASLGAPATRPVPTIDSTAHHTFQYLHLVAQVGANPGPFPPHLTVTDQEVAEALARWRLPAAAGRPLFGLNPGAEYGPAKRWPADRFIAAAREVQAKTRCQWLMLGGPADRELAQHVTAGIEAGGQGGVMNLAGQTSLRELCALLKTCRVLLTNDTGPMHVAAALGTPVVVPFGSTSPELTGPGLPGDRRHQLLCSHVICAPCFLRNCPVDFACMGNIAVPEVVAAVLRSWRAR